MGTFSKWLVSDLDLTALNLHAGESLRQMGIHISVLDFFTLFEHEELQVPSLVIMSCVAPPTSHYPVLRHLIKRYQHYTPDDGDARQYYAAFAFEAVIGQLPAASVVSVCRKSDRLFHGSSPATVAALEPVPGYAPKSCHCDARSLQPLKGARDLVAQVSLGGPIDPTAYLGGGKLDMIQMCAEASRRGVQIVFLAEWDGSLSLGVARGVFHHQQARSLRPLSWKAWWSVFPERKMKDWSGAYSEFHEYALDWRANDLLKELERRAQMGDQSEGLPLPQSLQPHANVNAACMWFFASLYNNGRDVTY